MIADVVATAEEILIRAVLCVAVAGGIVAVAGLPLGIWVVRGIRQAVGARRSRACRQTPAEPPHAPSGDSRDAGTLPEPPQRRSETSAYKEAA